MYYTLNYHIMSPGGGFKNCNQWGFCDITINPNQDINHTTTPYILESAQLDTEQALKFRAKGRIVWETYELPFGPIALTHTLDFKVVSLGTPV